MLLFIPFAGKAALRKDVHLWGKDFGAAQIFYPLYRSKISVTAIYIFV